MKTPFDDLFDLDDDGELDTFEEATATEVFFDLLDDSDEKKKKDADLLDDIDFDD